MHFGQRGIRTDPETKNGIVIANVTGTNLKIEIAMEVVEKEVKSVIVTAKVYEYSSGMEYVFSQVNKNIKL